MKVINIKCIYKNQVEETVKQFLNQILKKHFIIMKIKINLKGCIKVENKVYLNLLLSNKMIDFY